MRLNLRQRCRLFLLLCYLTIVAWALQIIRRQECALSPSRVNQSVRLPCTLSVRDVPRQSGSCHVKGKHLFCKGAKGGRRRRYLQECICLRHARHFCSYLLERVRSPDLDDCLSLVAQIYVILEPIPSPLVLLRQRLQGFWEGEQAPWEIWFVLTTSCTESCGVSFSQTAC